MKSNSFKRVLAILGLTVIACAILTLIFGAVTKNIEAMMSALVILIVGSVVVYGMMMLAKLLKKD